MPYLEEKNARHMQLLLSYHARVDVEKSFFTIENDIFSTSTEPAQLVEKLRFLCPAVCDAHARAFSPQKRLPVAYV